MDPADRCPRAIHQTPESSVVSSENSTRGTTVDSDDINSLDDSGLNKLFGMASGSAGGVAVTIGPSDDDEEEGAQMQADATSNVRATGAACVPCERFERHAGLPIALLYGSSAVAMNFLNKCIMQV